MSFRSPRGANDIVGSAISSNNSSILDGVLSNSTTLPLSPATPTGAAAFLIGLAISVAFLSSAGASLGLLPHELDFWWELVLLEVIMLLGHWIEMRSLAQTTSALDSLAALLPDEAERVEDGGIVRVTPAELRTGDVVLVRPG